MRIRILRSTVEEQWCKAPVSPDFVFSCIHPNVFTSTHGFNIVVSKRLRKSKKQPCFVYRSYKVNGNPPPASN